MHSANADAPYITYTFSPLSYRGGADSGLRRFFFSSQKFLYIILQIRQATTVDKRVDIRTITIGIASFLTLSPAKYTAEM